MLSFLPAPLLHSHPTPTPTQPRSPCPRPARSKYILVRADVGRLPFPTGSVAGLHAGAALHCWPNPQAAFAEISRVLAPGGVFVASTFLSATAPLGQALQNDGLVRPLAQVGGAGGGVFGGVGEGGDRHAALLRCTAAGRRCDQVLGRGTGICH